MINCLIIPGTQMFSESIISNSAVVEIPSYSTSMKYFPGVNYFFSNGNAAGTKFSNPPIGIGIALLPLPYSSLI